MDVDAGTVMAVGQNQAIRGGGDWGARVEKDEIERLRMTGERRYQRRTGILQRNCSSIDLIVAATP